MHSNPRPFIVIFMSGPLHSTKTFGLHSIGGWVDTNARLEVMINRNIPGPVRNRTPVMGTQEFYLTTLITGKIRWWIEEWEWNTGGTLLTEDGKSTGGETSVGATSSTTNSWPRRLWSDPGPLRWLGLTNKISYWKNRVTWGRKRMDPHLLKRKHSRTLYRYRMLW